MSLFPAYAEEKDNEGENKEDSTDSAGPSWLSYPCYALSGQKTSSSSSSDTENVSQKDSNGNKERKRKKKKMKKERKKPKSQGAENEANKLYVLDEGGNSKAPLVKQVSLAKPVYSGINVSSTKKKKKKKKRYFFGKGKAEEENDAIDMSSTMSIEDFLKKTEEFNKKLRIEPNNVYVWMEYVRLQDLGVGTKIGKAEKKLSILDKALEENSDSEELLNEKMTIYESIHPFEKVSSEVKSLLSKYPHNPVGWRWLIQATQYSLSKMTAPGVLQAFEQVLESLHRVRQHNTPVFLDTLLQCMLFLRQAGLWEHLWLLTELYLELTYTTAGSGAFKINVEIREDEIQNLEDTVLTSGLTLGALWLRTEHLRECIHFSPVLDSPDPQRTVFVDDLSGLLFPLGSATYSRLMCHALVSFKVPPLPMTEAFYEFVGLKSIPWSLDNAEILLTANCDRGILQMDSTYLEACRDLLVGPQYLNRTRLGTKEFFESVDTLFRCCINNCAEEDVPSLLAWQVRWWTYVIQNTFHINEDIDLSKDLRTKAKTLLKKYRECLPLYSEYALYEAQVGNFDVSIKVLETAMELQQPPLTAGRDRRNISALYKMFVELLLRKDFVSFKDRVIKVLIAMAFGEPVKNIIPNEDLIIRALDKMSHITTEIVREFEINDTLSDDITSLKDVSLTHDSVSWLSCNAWFLYLTKDVWQSCALLEKAIQVLEKFVTSQPVIRRCVLENLYETLLSIMNHFCNTHSSQFQVLQEMIDRAIKHFPNNTYFLHLLASTKISSTKWQKISSNIISTNSPLAYVMLVFILTNKLFSEEQQQLITKENAHKRITNLIKRLAKEKCTERCPLVWRLALQSTSTLSMEETRSIFFLAVEKCPWVKMLYYEGAKMLPEDLPQIQDLLVEKELRLHITPEELEILREELPPEENNCINNSNAEVKNDEETSSLHQIEKTDNNLSCTPHS